MKVCVDIRPAVWYANTGIGVYTYELVKELSKDESNDYVFILPFGSDPYNLGYEKFLLDREKKIKKNICLEYANNNAKSDNNESEILNIIISHKADIYHNTQNGIGMPKAKVCKYVVTIHDVIPIALPNYVSDKYLRAFLMNAPNAIYNSDAIITVSNYSKNDIIKRFKIDEDKIWVTYLGAEDIYNIEHREEAKMKMKYKYGILENYILYVGGLNGRKNVDLLIRAYNRVYNHFETSHKLVIAGKISEKNMNLIELVKTLKIEENVLFPGNIEREDMAELYNSATLFVYPSQYEGFGLPLLEAMKSKIAIVASDATSIPEVAEEAVVYFKADDEIDLSMKIEEMINNIEKRSIYIERGIKQCNKYSFEKMAIESIDIYRSVML